MNQLKNIHTHSPHHAVIWIFLLCSSEIDLAALMRIGAWHAFFCTDLGLLPWQGPYSKLPLQWLCSWCRVVAFHCAQQTMSSCVEKSMEHFDAASEGILVTVWCLEYVFEFFVLVCDFRD